jgi:hypothetical protein
VPAEDISVIKYCLHNVPEEDISVIKYCVHNVPAPVTVGFEALIAVIMNSFWDATLCSLVDGDQYFRRTIYQTT